MKVAFIGDIVGKPGRNIIKKELQKIKNENNIDFIIANGENASHGFGLTIKNAKELENSGIGCITGGNHTWDKKKDIEVLLEGDFVLRPHNYPKGVKGTGLKIVSINDQKIAILNLMGIFSMPQVTNPFLEAQEVISYLHQENIKHIFIDFHAESTAEKRILMQLFQGKVSAICGTHTHVGTDDLEITNNTFYVSDIGLTGCIDNVIGMESKMPIQKALTGIGGHFEVPTNCKSILQMIIVEVDEIGHAIDAQKIKVYSNNIKQILKATIN